MQKNALTLPFLKNKIFIFFLFIAIVISVQYSIVYFKNHTTVSFYPYVEQPSTDLSRIYRFFKNEKYSTITSFVDQVLSNGTSVSFRADLLFWQAESYFQLQQYQLAEQKFLTLYQEYPLYWQAKLRLAALHILLNKNLEEFLTMIQHIPDCYELFYWKGQYFEFIGANSDAISSYYKSDTKDIRVAFALGNMLYKQGNYIKAQDFFNSLINNPKAEQYKKESLLTLFQIAKKLKNIPGMIRYSNSLKPYIVDDLETIRNISGSFYSEGDVQHARDVFSLLDNSEKMTPYIAQTLLQLSFELKNYSSVLKYARYITINTSNISMILESAYKLKKLEYVIRTINTYLDKQPQDLILKDKVKILHILADAFQQLHRYISAINTLETIQQLDPKLDNQYQLLWLYQQVGDWEHINHLTSSIYNADNSTLLHLLNILIPAEQFQVAQSLLDDALSKNPNNEQILIKQAELYSSSKQWDPLRALLYKIIQLPPQNKQIQYQVNYALGCLDIQSKNYVEAEILLRKAQSINNTQEVNTRLLLIIFLEEKYEESRKLLMDIRQRFQSDLSPENRTLLFKIDKTITEAGY